MPEGTLGSTPLQKQYVSRSTVPPSNPFEDQIWIDTSGNNNEMNQYTGSKWELIIARGPDNPDNAVEGSLWRDSGAGSLKEYDGANWNGVSISDHSKLSNVTPDQHFAHATVAGTGSHADLSNVTPDQHHNRYADSEAISASRADNAHRDQNGNIIWDPEEDDYLGFSGNYQVSTDNTWEDTGIDETFDLSGYQWVKLQGDVMHEGSAFTTQTYVRFGPFSNGDYFTIEGTGAGSEWVRNVTSGVYSVAKLGTETVNVEAQVSDRVDRAYWENIALLLPETRSAIV